MKASRSVGLEAVATALLADVPAPAAPTGPGAAAALTGSAGTAGSGGAS